MSAADETILELAERPPGAAPGPLAQAAIAVLTAQGGGTLWLMGPAGRLTVEVQADGTTTCGPLTPWPTVEPRALRMVALDEVAPWGPIPDGVAQRVIERILAERGREEPEPDAHPAAVQAEHLEAFLDYARRGDRTGFWDLAGALGVHPDALEAMWTGTVRRLGGGHG